MTLGAAGGASITWRLCRCRRAIPVHVPGPPTELSIGGMPRFVTCRAGRVLRPTSAVTWDNNLM